MSLPTQHTLTRPSGSPPPLPPHLLTPITNPVSPMTRHQRTTDDIHDLDEKNQKRIPFLLDVQQNRLNVVLDKDARDDALRDFLRLLRDGVLVRDDGFARRGVDGGDDRNKILELVEVGGGDVDGLVERVDEGGEERAEGELGDDVGEVECCFLLLLLLLLLIAVVLENKVGWDLGEGGKG